MPQFSILKKRKRAIVKVSQNDILHYLIFTVRNSSCGKVIFSQACVRNSIRGGGGVHGRGACGAGGMHGRREACMARGHAWQGMGVHSKGGHV